MVVINKSNGEQGERYENCVFTMEQLGQKNPAVLEASWEAR